MITTVKVTFQNVVGEEINGKSFWQDVTIFVDDKELITVPKGSSAVADIETEEKQINIKATSNNANDVYVLENIAQGDKFTFEITLEKESNKLKIKRKY
jgi:hypothetical protein